MEDCQKKIYEIYSKYISSYLENFDDENNYEKLLLELYSNYKLN